jgi:hypothetical protein
MTWERWQCPSCGSCLELNDESPVEAWCYSCNESMVADQDDEGAEA